MTTDASAAKARPSSPRLRSATPRLRRLQALIRSPPRGSSSLGRRKRADRDVVSIRIPERELHRLSIRVQVRLLLESRDESARPRQGLVVVVDAEEQEEPVARCCLVRAHQGGMVVRNPTREGRARRFHLYPGSDRNIHGPEASSAGRRATGTT
jgi:hypothetical protein